MPPSPFANRLDPVIFEFGLPIGPDLVWQVLRVEGVEGLSLAYEFVVDLATDDSTTPYEEMLGADCELVLDRNGLARTIHGVITQIEAVMSSESRVQSAALTVRVKIVPAFRLLDQQIDTRFFMGRTVVEILFEVLTTALAPWSRTFDTGLVRGIHPPRDYCVQFRESTFAFCNRIMEEEGIAYFFAPDDAAPVEKLVLIDNNADASDADLLVAEAIPIVLNRAEELDRESIQVFEWRESRTPNRVLTRGYNFKDATNFDDGTAERTDPHHPTTRAVYHDDDRRQIVDDPISDPDAQSFTGTYVRQRVPLAERLLQLHTLQSAWGKGRSNAIGFIAGRVFTLGEHPAASLDHQEFLLTKVRHIGTSGSVDGDEAGYHNEFECTRRSDEYRPPLRTPKPRVHGIQTGVVVGMENDEIYTDQFGRIKVRFHRDRCSFNDEWAFCWIRVAQVWAGSGFGAVVLPRAGMEVAVSFVDGNPDCPLVTGCLYNSANMPPYALPGEKTKTTFKTCSSPGGDGFNELRFEDAQGSEQVFVHAQRRMDVRVRGSLYETAGGSREERIGWERGSERGGDHNTLVHKDVNHHVKEVRYTKIEKEQYETVQGDVIEDFQARHIVLVRNVSQLSAEKVVVEASDTISHRAGTIKITGSETLDIKAGGRIAIESNNAIEIKVGSSFISITPNEIAIQAALVRINSGGGVGPAGEAEAAVTAEMLEPLDALGADDGTPHHGRGVGGGGRTRVRRTLVPHHAPPLRPPSSEIEGGVLPSPPLDQSLEQDEQTQRGDRSGVTEDVILVLFTGYNGQVGFSSDAPLAPDEQDTTRLIRDRIVEDNHEDWHIRSELIGTTLYDGGLIESSRQYIIDQRQAHPGARVIIYGYSRGGYTALDLSRRLAEDDVCVDLLLTVDAAFGERSGAQDGSVPDNVGVQLNWFQTSSPDQLGSHGLPHFPVPHGWDNHGFPISQGRVYNQQLEVGHQRINEDTSDEVLEFANDFVRSGLSGDDWSPTLTEGWFQCLSQAHSRHIVRRLRYLPGPPTAE